MISPTLWIMRDLLTLFVHLIVILARLIGPGGARAIVAENLLLKQQLLVLTRARRRAHRLSNTDRMLFGLWSLFMNARRQVQAALILKPSTLSDFTPRSLSANTIIFSTRAPGQSLALKALRRS